MLDALSEHGQLQAICRRVVASVATFFHCALLHLEKLLQSRVIESGYVSVLREVLDLHQRADRVLVVWFSNCDRPETGLHLVYKETLSLRDNELAARTAKDSQGHQLGPHRHDRIRGHLVELESLTLRNFLSHQVPREP